MSEKVETGDAHSSKHVEFHEKTEKVSMWDFVHFNQSAELQSYMNSLAEAEEKENTNLVTKVLDQKVNHSARFTFYNPVFGSHGYFHVSTMQSSQSLVPPGTSPLHYAVFRRSYACLAILLSMGSDMNAIDDDNCTAFQLAKKMNDLNSLNAFKAHQLEIQNQRKRVYQLTAHNAMLKDQHSKAIALLAQVDLDREAYKSHLREITLKACAEIVAATKEKLVHAVLGSAVGSADLPDPNFVAN